MRLHVVCAGICLALLVPSSSAAQELKPPTANAKPDISVFHTESRQILVGAVVSSSDKFVATSRDEALKKALKDVPMTARPIVEGLIKQRQSVAGLAPGDIHIFDNGVEQKLNYFREADFPDADVTGRWVFQPTVRGVWGILEPAEDQRASKVIAIRPAMASYLIGYVPPALAPGECHTIKAIVNGHEIHLNRDRYCSEKSSDRLDEAMAEGTALGMRMRSLAVSKERGSIDLAVQAFAFRSSGVTHFGHVPSESSNGQVLPGSEFRYVIEVHDAKAPARVQITTEFNSPNIKREYRNGAFHLALHVLEMVYDNKGVLVEEFGDTYKNDFRAYKIEARLPARQTDDIDSSNERQAIPCRFDTQIDLQPGEYELRIVVSDGKRNFGHARLPLRVEPFSGEGLSISDIVLSNVFRNASGILQEAAAISPAELNPTPLVSKDAQFIPAADTRFTSRSAASLYFEIYEPLLEKQDVPVYFEMRLTDLRSGEVQVNTGPMSAGKWIQPGNAVTPIAVELAMKMLPKGSYKLQVRASDSAGRVTPWRQADFTVK